MQHTDNKAPTRRLNSLQEKENASCPDNIINLILLSGERKPLSLGLPLLGLIAAAAAKEAKANFIGVRTCGGLPFHAC
ncbi:hypothetical protein CEXT_537991 [Caerostris extrusa]|uniref:Uncharacterized protein n=1 Tax=Caerostris extrusa TaxID=172846 RepID=A0AAV4XJI0_CAEEX|nr:hypothetical protein CEXT_537991 [Caerostris extrusa]